MKNKLLVILPVVLCAFVQVNAQNYDASAAKQKEVIVNGKPYAQYKAEQDALKNQQNRQIVVAPTLPTAPTVTKSTMPEETINSAKTVQLNKPVITESNATGPTTAPVQKVKTNEGIDPRDKVIEASQTKATPVKTDAVNSPAVQAPVPMTEASKTSDGNSNGTTPLKTAEQKVETVPTGNSPAAKTKTE